jgi:hypothetical protein
MPSNSVNHSQRCENLLHASLPNHRDTVLESPCIEIFNAVKTMRTVIARARSGGAQKPPSGHAGGTGGRDRSMFGRAGRRGTPSLEPCQQSPQHLAGGQLGYDNLIQSPQLPWNFRGRPRVFFTPPALLCAMAPSFSDALPSCRVL